MITMQRVLFMLFAAIALGSAVKMVTASQVFHAALWLILVFIGTAALYVLLEAPFMTGLQLFIYVGGIAVLNILAIMVTRQMMLPKRTANEPFAAAAMVLVTFFLLVWMITRIPFPIQPLVPPPVGNLPLIGEALVDIKGYMVPFEVASLLLLVLLISVLYIAADISGPQASYSPEEHSVRPDECGRRR
jgi:NADH-quinone oxidoreductase subunit J